MKKLSALIGSLLILTGIKAQEVPVKKETVKPEVIKPVIVPDSIKSGKADTALKQIPKPLKIEKTIKETAVPIKNSKPIERPGKQ